MIADELWVERGGSTDPDGAPLLVLLHGMGHTAQVWRGLVELLDGRRWLAVDLPGHGRSPWTGRYSFDAVAAAVAAAMDPVLPAGRTVLAVGHSMGGVIALALAALRPEVRGVLGFGIKVAWTAEELAAMGARAAKPPKVFGTPDEARAAFIRFAGLDGVVSPDSALARSGIAETGSGYRLAADPRTMAVGAPDMPPLLAAARANATVVLARGEHDHMVSDEALRAVDAGAVVVPGVGHNFHVTHPLALRKLADTVGGVG
ncbi:MAG TPA: alpha/beta fold hydrolase [Pseudonocardiaceae bacterium]